MMELSHISYIYGKQTANECKVLEDVSLTIQEGEFLGVIGASGSGKTTLVKHLNGLLRADSGQVLFEGRNIYDKKYSLSSLRKEVGLIFQYPEQQLFCRTVLEDVCFGPVNLGMSREEALESAKDCLEMVGIPEAYYYVSPLELSGGEKRRVAIAGVLAMKPKILVMDEPAAGLDPETKHMIFRLIRKIRAERGTAVVLVSHHMEDVADYADQIVVLHQGRIAFTGTPSEVFSHLEELREMGIGVPQITTATDRLIRAGIPLAHPAVTVDDAETMILEWYQKETEGGR